jgi:hypothetical protein
MRLHRGKMKIEVSVWRLLLLAMLIPICARAQQSVSTGAIAGSAKDSSGAILAGATVTASSPALIEHEKSVTTDDHGEYKIEGLRPGVYTVTFALQGFASVQFKDLELNTGTTIPVDAAMKVATVTQSVTVSSATTPVVDVENTNPQNVLTNTVLTTVPQAGGIQAYTALTLGVTQTGVPDVGGNKGEQITSIVTRDSRTNNDDEMMDGMSWSSGQSTGGLGQRSYVINKISVQELTISTGTAGADAGHPGANVNIVPREGGDTFHGAVNFTGATTGWQSHNLDAALVARGLTSGQNIKYTYDLGAGVGGPIKPGKVWFWVGYGQWAAEEYAPGNYFNATQNTLFYTPDLKKQAFTQEFNYATDLRIDYQLTKKDKISIFQGYEDFCLCFQSVDIGNIAPEAANNNWNRASFLTQLAWERQMTNRLVTRVGYTAALAPGRVNAYSQGVSNTDVPIVNQTTGYGYHAFLGQSSLAYGHPVYQEQNGVATAAYVTGSHAIKGGFTWQRNDQNYKENLNVVPGVGPVSYTFKAAPAGYNYALIPVSITEYASPLYFTARSWVNALYGEDQWTIHRLTLNLGLRYDWERGYAPAQTVPATPFVPTPTTFAAVQGIPDWNDIEPRIGAAYDLFGNAKTAIRGAVGRYVIGDYTSTTIANTPANAIVTSATRSWNMTQAEVNASGGNYVPNCNLTNSAANGGPNNNECGALSNNGFGSQNKGTTYDPSILSGWNVRPFNWQADVEIQQQLRPGVGLTVGYYRTWYGNFTATQNRSLTPSQYTSFCITGPVDSRVSALTGKSVCGFHDPNVTGAVNNYVTSAGQFGGQSEVYNGFDFKLNARFGHGGFLQGGLSLGNTAYNDCAIAKNYPNVTASETNYLATVTSNNTTPSDFCAYSISWSKQAQVKFTGAYPLPWYGIEGSFTFQNLPGYLYNTSYNVTAAQTTLGRNFISNASSETLSFALYSPFTQSENRLNQLDLRLTKLFKVHERLKIRANFDVYNIANANTVITETTTYSTTNSYLKPTSILGPRMFKLGANLSF